MILRKGDSAYGERGFWAPQLFKEGNRYYLTYTANEHTALASSNSVYGPFRQDSIRPIDETAKISIHFYSKIQMESTTCIMYVSTKEIICG